MWTVDYNNPGRRWRSKEFVPSASVLGNGESDCVGALKRADAAGRMAALAC
jgi:hypothetical protein